MRFGIWFTLFLVLTSLPFSTYAAPAWYSGEVSRVALTGSDGSFIVTFQSGSLDDCKHKYAYFQVGSLGKDKVDRAYAMAITSLTAGVQMGVVIDKSINGVGGYCHARGMAADLRAE